MAKLKLSVAVGDYDRMRPLVDGAVQIDAVDPQFMLLEPEEIRRIRKKLRLTQAAAGELIGGGPRAFQKYETGDLLPSRAISSALALLDHDPRSLTVLEARRMKNPSRRHEAASHP